MRHRCVSSQAADSGEGVAGCVLDARQRLVDRQHVADMLCAVNTEVVVPDAANESRIDVSAGADSGMRAHGKRTPARSGSDSP